MGKLEEFFTRNKFFDKTASLVTDFTVTAVTVMILNSGILVQ